MATAPVIARRDLIKATATIAVAAPAIAATAAARGEELPGRTKVAPVPPAEEATQPTSLATVPLGPDTKLTVERRGQLALLGLNRPANQNRIDPETFRRLAEAIHDYDHDPSLRAMVLFGYGENFSRGIDIDAYKAVASSGNFLAGLTQVTNPLNYGQNHRTKPLIAAVHGDTWNMAHELFLAADVRVAAANTNFGQDENSHGRFPGGGSTIRFVREAGWGNAMRYMLTGDHWSAEDARRMGLVQEVADTPGAALERAIAIATKVAGCAPLGVKATLSSAHLAVDTGEAPAFSNLGAQYSALVRTNDFFEGLAAQSEGRPAVFEGK